MADTADVVVVGAGVIGGAVAYNLAREGAKVRILEQEAIGSGASAHATGSISLVGAEFTPGPSFEEALESYRMFPDLVSALEEETGMDLLYQRKPSIRLVLDDEEERLIEDLREWQMELRPTRWIDGDEVRRIEPRLSPNILKAAYEDESAQLDSYRLTLALGRAAEKRGAELHLRKVTGLITEGARVTGVKTSGGDFHCGTVVLAAGAWCADFGRDLGCHIPVRPLKGERLLLKYEGDPLPVLISSPKRGHMISRLDGLLSVGSTGGRDYDNQSLFLGVEFDRVPTETAKLELLQRAVDVFPVVESAQLVQQLAGSRPLTPDRMPILGPVPGWDGVMLATGHATKGIHLAPITGRVIADYVLRGETGVPVDMDAFLVSRFDGAESHDYEEAGKNVEE